MAILDLHIGSGGPVYQQIMEQVKQEIAGGKLMPGTRLPTVRDLAQHLKLNPSTVAKAYAELERQGIILTRRGSGSFVAAQPDNRLTSEIREEKLSNLLGRVVLEALSLGFEPEEVEASLELHLARWRASRSRRQTTSEPARPLMNQLTFAGSHDLAVELLFSQFRRVQPEIGLSAMYVGSLGGLIALEQGQANLVGCHLLDEETGEYNLPYVRRLLTGQDVVVVTLVERMQGLIVPKGNPLGISEITHLARPGIRFVNRQRGSGTRVLLDFKLRQLGVSPSDIGGYGREEETHIGVASAVADGTADVGLGIYAAARSLSLNFIPVQKERYDLVMLRPTFQSPALQSLLQILRNDEFRKVVTAMGGYDIANSGRVVLPKNQGETIG